MKKNFNPSGIFRKTSLAMIMFAGIQIYCSGQGITVYQYRHVPADKVAEFVNRETTYWSKVAEKAIEKGNLTFWAILQKMSGYDLQNSSNFLFVNTYNDIDAAGEVWDPTSAFPGVSMDKMETGSLSTVTTMAFVMDQHWEQAADAQPEDFKYLTVIYHTASNPEQLIQLEKDHWAPFIKKAMDEKKTTQVGWGNAVILSPSGEDVKFNTVSYDIYPSLKEALATSLADDIVFPEQGLEEIMKIETAQRSSVIYRLVKMVQAPAGN
jgi:hypothetical protein